MFGVKHNLQESKWGLGLAPGRAESRLQQKLLPWVIHHLINPRESSVPGRLFAPLLSCLLRPSVVPAALVPPVGNGRRPRAGWAAAWTWAGTSQSLWSRQPGGRCCCKACLGLCSCDEAREKPGGGGRRLRGGLFFPPPFLLRSLPRARLVHSQAGRVRRRLAAKEGALGTSLARVFWLLPLSLRLGEGVTRRLGAGEVRRSHGRRELHRAAQPGAAARGELHARRARAQRRWPLGRGGARHHRGPRHRCRGPRHQGMGAPGHLRWEARIFGVGVGGFLRFPPRELPGPSSPICKLGSANPSLEAFQGLLRQGGARAAASAAGGLRLCRGSPGEATAPSAVIKSAPCPRQLSLSPHSSGGSHPARGG